MMAADTYAGFRTGFRQPARRALRRIADPGDLLRAEVDWWASVDRDLGHVLSADAWRARAALESAAHGGVTLEAFDGRDRGAVGGRDDAGAAILPSPAPSIGRTPPDSSGRRAQRGQIRPDRANRRER